MPTHKFALITLAMMIFTSACGGQPEPQLPTLAPAPEELVLPTPTIAPSATPTERLLVRPTLPPTFTPTDTETPLPTETPTETFTPVIAVYTPDPSCNNFRVLTETSMTSFPLGTAPRVEWTPVAGAERYWIIIANDAGITLRNDIYVAETSYTFPADLFEAGRIYGWTVAPINNAGIQMCLEIGLELIPFTGQ